MKNEFLKKLNELVKYQNLVGEKFKILDKNQLSHEMTTVSFVATEEGRNNFIPVENGIPFFIVAIDTKQSLEGAENRKLVFQFLESIKNDNFNVVKLFEDNLFNKGEYSQLSMCIIQLVFLKDTLDLYTMSVFTNVIEEPISINLTSLKDYLNSQFFINRTNVLKILTKHLGKDILESAQNYLQERVNNISIDKYEENLEKFNEIYFNTFNDELTEFDRNQENEVEQGK